MLGMGDDRGVSFTPAWTGSFRVMVHIIGSVYNNYVLLKR
jgi:hypothetical protein